MTAISIPTLIKVFIGSLIGTWGFALMLSAPRKSWIPAALMGGIGYALYWLAMELGLSEPASIFIASLAASLLAQACARRMQMIATIFVALSIIPLVPGLGLYRCMELLGQGQNGAGLQTGVAAMISIMMIALGVAVGGFLFRAAVSRVPKADHRKEGI